MDVSAYINSDAVNRTISEYAENAKFETTDKVKNNFKAVASEAYNEGVLSIIATIKKPTNKGLIEKSKNLTNLLPDVFCKDEMGKTAIDTILSAIISNQTDGIMNIGYEEILRREIENMVRIIYAIGVTSGFDY